VGVSQLGGQQMAREWLTPDAELEAWGVRRGSFAPAYLAARIETSVSLTVSCASKRGAQAPQRSPESPGRKWLTWGRVVEPAPFLHAGAWPSFSLVPSGKKQR